MLSCDVVSVGGGVVIVLYMMRVVRGVILCVVCEFRHVGMVCYWYWYV